MQIKMKRTAPGSNDGATVQEYREGETYTVSDMLGAEFVRAKWADEVADEKPTPAKRGRPAKADEPAPEADSE